MIPAQSPSGMLLELDTRRATGVLDNDPVVTHRQHLFDARFGILLAARKRLTPGPLRKLPDQTLWRMRRRHWGQDRRFGGNQSRVVRVHGPPARVRAAERSREGVAQ